MVGIIKDGNVFVSGPSIAIDDSSIRSDRTWSSEKISKINVKDAKKVDALPTYSAGTITYVKDGVSYTTTNDKQWFYYLENGSLKQTIFIDGEELTIDGASVDFDEFVKKSSIATTIDSNCTNEQVAGAKAIFSMIKWINEYGVFDSPKDSNNDFYRLFFGNSKLYLQKFLSDDTNIAKLIYDFNSGLAYEVSEDLNNIVTNCFIMTTYDTLNQPHENANFMGISVCYPGNTKYSFQILCDANENQSTTKFRTMYIRHQYDGVWSDWGKICTTNVDDVPDTKFNLTTELDNLVGTRSNNWNHYTIKNGECHAYIEFILTSSTTSDVAPNGWLIISEDIATASVNSRGTLVCHPSGRCITVGTTAGEKALRIKGTIPSGTNYIVGSLDFPVAE